MEHYKEGQYDDDLTVGIDEYDDFDTGGVDLFEYIGDDDSPLARLKSIILSIDWEITDDILRQFNEELLDLKEIWSDNKVNLIYVQALEKISRYIYKEKSSAHPNAIKLLLTFYTNLEKIVSDDEMPEREKKQILLDDIERFEKLKKQIAPSATPKSSPSPSPAQPVPDPEPVVLESETEKTEDSEEYQSPALKSEPAAASFDAADESLKLGEAGQADPLLNLKAIVYGIDWEITEKDLKNLSREVKTLEEEFRSSKAKRIFLQGIGSLGSYINLKRSDSHADAFKLLHSFFTGLETVVRRNLSGKAEKDILFPLVEKFNTFKAAIADTLSPEAIARSSQGDEDGGDGYEDSDIQPAFADVSDEVKGFNEEEHVSQLESDADSPVDVYFDEDGEAEAEEYEASGEALASEMEDRLTGMFDEPDESVAKELAAEIALQGVDVETEADDESDEEPLPELDGELAPALAAEEEPLDDESPAVFTDKVDEFFEEPDVTDNEMLGQTVPGVDVDHEADDDSEEEPLPFEDGEIAPALAADAGALSDEEREDEPAPPVEESDIDDQLDDFFGSEPAETGEMVEQEGELDEEGEAEFLLDDEEPEDTAEEGVATDVEGRLDDFFGDDDVDGISEDDALRGVEVDHEADDESDEEPLPLEDGEFAPALSSEDDDVSEEEPPADEESAAIEESFDNLFGEEDELDDAPVAEEDESLEFDFDEESITDEAPAFDEDEIDGRVEGFGLEDEEVDVAAEEALQGVDVDHEADDDADEEPLFFEDGEVAPALSADEDHIRYDEDESEDAEAAGEVDDQFDSLFGDEPAAIDEEEDIFAEAEDEPEPITFEEADEPEPITFDETDEDELEAALGGEEELLFSSDDVDQDAGEDAARLTAFEEAGFEEIAEDGLEEIPGEKEAVPGGEERDDGLDLLEEPEEDIQDISDDAEILSLLGEEDGDLVTTPAETDEDDIPELSADELNVVLLGGDAVAAAGDIPPGYPSADELTSSFGEVAGDADDGEEVVFEAFEEDEESEEPSPAFADDFDESETFGTTLISERRDLSHHGLPSDDVAAERRIAAELEESIEEIKAEDSSAYVVPQGDGETEDNLSGLRSCIISLGLEIDDNILTVLTQEIDALRQAWLNKPAERTYVQLLSTIADHIERYRYEADPQANTLLLSVFDKLEICALGQAEPEQIQESLLAETSKVLQWQQRLIDRTPFEDLDNTPERRTQPLRQSDSGAAAASEKEISKALDDMSKQVDAIGDDLLMQKMSTMMRSELDQLKSAFHEELKALREEILKGK